MLPWDFVFYKKEGDEIYEDIEESRRVLLAIIGIFFLYLL